MQILVGFTVVVEKRLVVNCPEQSGTIVLGYW